MESLGNKTEERNRSLEVKSFQHSFRGGAAHSHSAQMPCVCSTGPTSGCMLCIRSRRPLNKEFSRVFWLYLSISTVQVKDRPERWETAAEVCHETRTEASGHIYNLILRQDADVGIGIVSLDNTQKAHFYTCLCVMQTQHLHSTRPGISGRWKKKRTYRWSGLDRNNSTSPSSLCVCTTF